MPKQLSMLRQRRAQHWRKNWVWFLLIPIYIFQSKRGTANSVNICHMDAMVENHALTHWVVIKWLSFEDENIEFILLNATWYIFTEDLLKSVPKRPLNNVLALVQISDHGLASNDYYVWWEKHPLNLHATDMDNTSNGPSPTVTFAIPR